MPPALTLSRSARYELSRSVGNFKAFCRYFLGINMRAYQVQAANAIAKSALLRDGRSFVIIFSRQSGKDELLADLFIYLMFRLQEMNPSIVCAQPTFKPQTVNAMERLLARTTDFDRKFRRTAGYILRLSTARVLYFSADPSAKVVGATADRLLVINEAQDVSPAVYDKRFSPMAASGNATKVFSGTSWTSDTLLERERRLALEAERADGIQRVFMADANQVAKCNPYYGKFVQGEIDKMGRNHPLIRTQYFNELIDAEAGMFNPSRLALMQGDQPGHTAPIPGISYAFLLDIGGQDEARMSLDDAPMNRPDRDAVSLTIVSVDTSTLSTLHAPTYRAVHRRQWIGSNHLTVFGALKALGELWRPMYIAIDATGVGEGLWALMDKAFPTRVLPVKFTQQEKSEIGWRFLAIIETGRFRDCCPTDAVREQYAACKSEILPGPAKTLRWGVPNGARGTSGDLLHDDYILADALIAILDRQEWIINMQSTILPSSIDPLSDLGRNF